MDPKDILKTRHEQQKESCIWCGKYIHLQGEFDAEKFVKRFSKLVLQMGEPEVNILVKQSQATREHIVPTSWRGGDIAENMAASCQKCNSTRGNDVSKYKPDHEASRCLPLAVRRTLKWVVLFVDAEHFKRSNKGLS